MSDGEITAAIHKLLFGVRRSVRYHSSRRRFFDRLHTWSAFLTALIGTGVCVSVLSEMDRQWSVVIALLVVAVSILDLVIDAPRIARLHNDLARRFIALEKELIALRDPSPEDLYRFQAARLEIESEEPPVMKVLDIMCHNELLRAMGYDVGFYRVSWYQRLFCHFIDIQDHRITPAH